jgi:hypothetical protein
LGDLEHFKNVLAGRPQGWPGHFPGRWSTLLKLTVPWYPRLHYEDFAAGDAKPGLAALLNWFREQLSRPKPVVKTKTAAEA